jgi:hypothetical protein
VSKVHFPAASVGGLAMSLLLCGVVGCGAPAGKSVEVPSAFNSLHNLSMGYKFAMRGLQRPPRNADEIKPQLEKMVEKPGDAKALLSSPTDGTDLIIQWGTDPVKQQEGQHVVWVYEKNASGGKRWVIQGWHPVEMTDEQLRNAQFAPGMKKPF